MDDARAAERDPVCASCGRLMPSRKRWIERGINARYCSAACRGLRLDKRDARIEETILELLARRAANATICPSEAAKQVSPGGWRALMERTRCAARRLVARGRIEMVQKGRVVDPSRARGAIRLRLRRWGYE